jgi:hypothetical protein
MSWAAAIGAGGAVVGGALGGKKQGGSTAPKWLRQDSKALGSFGQQLAQTPYTPYEGQRVAGFSPDTMAAFDMIRNNVGAATPAYQNAMSTAQGLTNFEAPQVTAAQWAGQDLSPYMNPYIDNVINAQAADQQNAYGQAYNGLASQAQAAGAFGGSRFGVAQGQLSADSVRDQALMSAQLRSQGFNTAAGLLGQDVDRQNWASGLNQSANLQADLANQGASMQSAGLRDSAARSLGWLGGQYQNSLAGDAAGMSAIGSEQQNLAQRGLDVGYADYMDRTRIYPQEQLATWQNAYGPAMQARGLPRAVQPPTGGGLLGALGGAQIGSQIGSGIANWWGSRNAYSPMSQPGFDPFDSYGSWQG